VTSLEHLIGCDEGFGKRKADTRELVRFILTGMGAAFVLTVGSSPIAGELIARMTPSTTARQVPQYEIDRRFTFDSMRRAPPPSGCLLRGDSAALSALAAELRFEFVCGRPAAQNCASDDECWSARHVQLLREKSDLL